jgi:hypothetical protein
MSALGKFLWQGLGNGGRLHDYSHAADVFRTNNFELSPKSKYLFQVNFVLSSNAPSYADTRTVAYLVKNIELPKFTFEVRDINQYNRKGYVQTKIKYDPISIRFHDDGANNVRGLWEDYYNYYVADGTYTLNEYNFDDRYQAKITPNWGLDNGSTDPFFSCIEIYSLVNGTSSKISLMNPVITSFAHDTHDYEAGQGIMEATVTIHYNGVTYEDGYAVGTPGFGNPQFYDPTLSDLTGSLVGSVFDNTIGQYVPATDQFRNRYINRQSSNYFYNQQNQAYRYNPTSTNNFSIPEIQSIVQNTRNNNTNNLYNFPVADASIPINSLNAANPDNVQAVPATSNGETVATPLQNNTVYQDGSYQQSLLDRGYTQNQINSADQYINTLSNDTISNSGLVNSDNLQTNKLAIAQSYIDNPDNMAQLNLGKVNYGQPENIPANINFSEPGNQVNATYESNTWQSRLAQQGYSDNDINIAASHLSQLNVAPDTDLLPLAQDYINYNKTSGDTQIV